MKTDLEKLTEYVTESVLGGNDTEDADARAVREMVLETIAREPEKFLVFAKKNMDKWMEGARHAWFVSRITIEDIDAAASHVMNAIVERFKSKASAVS